MGVLGLEVVCGLDSGWLMGVSACVFSCLSFFRFWMVYCSQVVLSSIRTYAQLKSVYLAFGALSSLSKYLGVIQLKGVITVVDIAYFLSHYFVYYYYLLLRIAQRESCKLELQINKNLISLQIRGIVFRSKSETVFLLFSENQGNVL